MKASINWIKDYVPCDLDADQIADKLTMAGLEVETIEAVGNDSVIEVEITSNRPDWLSHLGIAREIGAIIGKSVTYPTIKDYTPIAADSTVSVQIEDTDLCPFYSAILLENVSFGSSPDFIVERLEAVGLRSINLPVDLTNYILLEYGQPLHAFDNDCIGAELVIRRARDNESFTALNDKAYALLPSDLVISDTDGAIALAGVMGGQKSEVTDSTKNILLESAFFNPNCIRTTSRRLLLVSDASYRFERTVDPGAVITASDRFISLMLEYGTVGKIHTRVSAGTQPLRTRKVRVSYDYVNKILGHAIEPKAIDSILYHLGMTIDKSSASEVEVSIPSFRHDLDRPIDLVEEIARIYGYDNIPETYPHIPMLKKNVDSLLALEASIRTTLSGLSLNEIITFSLEQRDLYQTFAPQVLDTVVSIINPSNKELNVLRPSLINGMLHVVKHNINTGNRDLRLFEVGRRYTKNKGQLPNEEKVVSLCLTGELINNWLDHSRTCTFFDLKGIVLSLLQKCNTPVPELNAIDDPFCSDGFQVISHDIVVGWMGNIKSQILAQYDIKQEVFYAELSLEKVAALQSTNKQFAMYSKYPASYRDISIVVSKSVFAGKIIETIRLQNPDLIRSVKLYDRFTGKNIEKDSCSLTFAIEYQADDHTLEHSEIDALHAKIIDVLSQEYNATLR